MRSLISVVVLGTHLLLFAQELLRRYAGIDLPLPRELGNVTCYGMFCFASPRAAEYSLWLSTLEGDGSESWREAPAAEVFPFPRGLRWDVMNAGFRQATADGTRKEVGQRRTGEKIRAYFNRLDPTRPVHRVAYGYATWPIDDRGPYANRTPELTTSNFYILTAAPVAPVRRGPALHRAPN